MRQSIKENKVIGRASFRLYSRPRNAACANNPSLLEVRIVSHKPFGRIAFLAILLASICTFSFGQQPQEPYSVVHGWPQLPPGFVLGQVSGVSVDSHNHVFVFHRAENSWATDKTHVIP